MNIRILQVVAFLFYCQFLNSQGRHIKREMYGYAFHHHPDAMVQPMYGPPPPPPEYYQPPPPPPPPPHLQSQSVGVNVANANQGYWRKRRNENSIGRVKRQEFSQFEYDPYGGHFALNGSKQGRRKRSYMENLLRKLQGVVKRSLQASANEVVDFRRAATEIGNSV